ncbi:Isochorismatase-like protein [Hypoxylon argillaceum]|nr:Isochorismatase-like protein [Hypoxylon argillaceum]
MVLERANTQMSRWKLYRRALGFFSPSAHFPVFSRRHAITNTTLRLRLHLSQTSHTMASSNPASSPIKVIGNKSHFWLWSESDGFDLTRPAEPDSPQVHPRITLQTTNSPVTITPHKTALVIIDMQNFFLSRSLGRKGEGHEAEAALLKHALPAAREAGIQVIWLSWGLTDAELEAMSPTMLRVFKFSDNGSSRQVPVPGETSQEPESYTDGGMGAELGEVTLGDGTKVDMGRMMMRDQWNTDLHKPLRTVYEASLDSDLPHVRLHKNRISGVSDTSSALVDYLEGAGAHIKTLLFTGVNTDQCVYGTMQDANLKGWDTVLLKDGCGTISPGFATQMSVHNASKSWGFCSTCEQLAYAVKQLSHQGQGAKSWRHRLLHLSTSTVRRFCAAWRKLACRQMRRAILWNSHGRPGGMMSSVLVLNRSFGQSCWLVTKGDTTQPRTRASISERQRQNLKPPRVTNESVIF